VKLGKSFVKNAGNNIAKSMRCFQYIAMMLKSEIQSLKKWCRLKI